MEEGEMEKTGEERGKSCLGPRAGRRVLGGKVILGQGAMERRSWFPLLSLLLEDGICVTQVICFLHSNCQAGYPPATGTEPDPDLGIPPW